MNASRMMKLVGSGSIAALALIFGALGCESSSHYSESRYEYNSDPNYTQTDSRYDSRYNADQPPPSSGRRPKADQLNGEYQMVSPGEMVVDPK